MKKVCVHCGVEKDINDFWFRNKKENKRRERCISCKQNDLKIYRTKNKQQIQQKKKAAYSTHIGIAQRLFREALKRSKFKQIPFDISVSDINVPFECPALGIPIIVGNKTKQDNSPTLDRLVPSLGYVKGNIAVISSKANNIKSNAHFSEILKVGKWLKKVNK